jgi:5-oxoprolinase (ATP-hydrolysing)
MQALPMRPGDVVVTNHPALGGSHLPDITVISPYFVPGSPEPFAFVASRAHHAELGGKRPGSMPPDATALEEEGVVIAPQYLLQGGHSRMDSIRRLLTEAPYPTRAITQNLADLEAAVAANEHGLRQLDHLVQSYGSALVQHHMARLKAYAAQSVREALALRRPGVYEAVETLDDGAPIHVKIAIQGGEAVIDFTGSAPVHPGNYNATAAIVNSAVLYVLRLLIDEPLPLNEGLLAPVTIVLPAGMLHPPFDLHGGTNPAVVAGNTETSQRVVDALMKALGIAAASQGTMNNVLFGNATFGYYETIGGGTGATAAGPGADAVHSHMTNTRLTDPEILEHRYPVRLLRCAVRDGSGGAGQHRGGHGMIREFEFLAPVSVSILSQRRESRPYGIAGGGGGEPGRQTRVFGDGTMMRLGSNAAYEAAPGERLLIETPGGGGYGAP